MPLTYLPLLEMVVVSQPGRSAKQGHRITSEKRPWWQRSVTHVFDDMDLEMPAANTIEFDQFIKSHYNI